MNPHDRESPSGQPKMALMGHQAPGAQVLTVVRVERFHCPRCGYTRPLKRGEDGCQLYVLHEERCMPAVGKQLWFPFITEDDLKWSQEGEERVLHLPAALRVAGSDLVKRGDRALHPPLDSFEAA